jgi:hypothetical protein
MSQLAPAATEFKCDSGLVQGLRSITATLRQNSRFQITFNE